METFPDMFGHDAHFQIPASVDFRYSQNWKIISTEYENGQEQRRQVWNGSRKNVVVRYRFYTGENAKGEKRNLGDMLARWEDFYARVRGPLDPFNFYFPSTTLPVNATDVSQGSASSGVVSGQRTFGFSSADFHKTFCGFARGKESTIYLPSFGALSHSLYRRKLDSNAIELVNHDSYSFNKGTYFSTHNNIIRKRDSITFNNTADYPETGDAFFWTSLGGRAHMMARLADEITYNQFSHLYSDVVVRLVPLQPILREDV